MPSPSRKWLWRIGKRTCHYCNRNLSLWGNELNNLTVDHVVPRSKGGPDTKRNWVAACPPCNGAKGSTDAGEFWRAKAAQKQAANTKLLRGEIDP